MVKRQAFMKKSSKQKRQNANANSNAYSVVPMVTHSLNVGMPYKLQTKLRFARSYAVAHAGATQKFLWAANAPNFPSRTLGTSDLPFYWDTITDIYSNVYVLRSRINVTVTNISLADALECVLTTTPTGSTPSSMLELSSRVGARSAQLGHYQGGNAVARFSANFTPNTMMGVPPTDSSNVIIGTIDPPNLYYFVVGILSTGGSSGNVGIHVDIEYDVVADELRS